jgi:membrane-bound lytic murein transglycosylase D
LQEEFDRIVDAVNALEMEALKQGNGFVPKEEETPADVASDVTFEVDPNIVAKARADLATTNSDLPLVVNDYVATYINFFANTQKGHNTLLHSFQRAGRYKAMIQRVMAEEGVPQDLIYLAVAESGFQSAASIAAPRRRHVAVHAARQLRAGAQRLCGRALRSGKIHARLRPLHEVHLRPVGRLVPVHGRLRLGRGQCAARRAEDRLRRLLGTLQAQQPARETKNYVPEILAAIIIANHPTQYGFDDVTLDPPVLTDTVTINYSVDLRLVSDIVGAPVDELMALNPSLLRMETPPAAGRYAGIHRGSIRRLAGSICGAGTISPDSR